MTSGADAASPRRPVPVMLWIAAAVGTVHGAWSLYWAFGGRMLLETVGRWAVEAVDAEPLSAFIVLFGAGVAKLLAAWIPLLAERGHLPGRRMWRAISWIGGPALIVYGSVNAIAAGAVLMGWVGTDADDLPGLIGHAFIWDPMFAVWGAALTIGLVATRSGRDGRQSFLK